MSKLNNAIAKYEREKAALAETPQGFAYTRVDVVNEVLEVLRRLKK